MALCQAGPPLHAVSLILPVIAYSTGAKPRFLVSLRERETGPGTRFPTYNSWGSPLTTPPVLAHAHEVPGLVGRSKIGHTSLLIGTTYGSADSFPTVQPGSDSAHGIQSVFCCLQT